LTYLYYIKEKREEYGNYVFKYNRNGNLVFSVHLKTCGISSEVIVYLKNHVYVVGKVYPEDHIEATLCVFSKDLKFLEKKTIAKYYEDEVNYAFSEPEYLVSDGKRLYIGVKVGEKAGK